MGRPKKVILTPEQEVEKLEGEIAELTAEIKAKKERVKELKEAIANADMNEITEAVKASGLSKAQILEMLAKK